jgi:predicted Zn-dependent protease
MNSISLKNNVVQTSSGSTSNSEKSSFSLSPKQVTMNIRSGPSMSNLAQMVIENSNKIDIVRLHNSIKIDVKPTRWRWGQA